MRRLVVSRDHATRLDAAREYLVAREGHEAILILGPTKRAVDDFVKTAGPGPTGPGVALLGAHRLTLDLYARDLAALPFAEAKIARIAHLGTEALAARAVHVARAARPLAYFEPVADTPGFASAVARTVHDLREAGVDAEALAADPRDAAADLSRLLTAYERELWSLGLADRAKTLTTAADVAQRGEHPLARLPVLLLDVLPKTRAESRLVEAIAARQEVFATAPAHDEARVAALAALLDAEVEPRSPNEAARSLDRARRYVFLEAHAAPEAPDSSLTFFSAPGEARECIEITRRIQKLAARGVPFDRIAVLLRSPQSYTPLLMDALRRAEIPGFFTRGVRRPDPAGRAVLALLSCAAEGLSASRFAEYLSLGRTPPLTETGAPVAREVPWVPPKEDGQMVFFTKAPEVTAPAEPAGPPPVDVPLYWEKLLVDAAVIGGRERWARRLAGLKREIELQIDALEEKDPSRRKKKERDLEQLENLERFALPIVDFLAELPERAKWRTWLDRIGELATRAIDEPEPILALLAELRPMGDVGPVGLDEVRLVLTERLSFLREDPIGPRFGRVFVAPIDEALGRTFDVVFLPGLAEGIFPQRVYEDPLFLDADRARLRDDLPLRERRLAEERDRLHTALGAATDEAYVSYPRMNVIQGRPRVPSFYALDVLRAAEGRLPSLAELFERGTSAADTRLGWPAPRRAIDAIDDAEYDLAILGPLVFERPDAVRGRGRYLIEDERGQDTNEHLVRALRTCATRWRSAWRKGDGLVESDTAVKRALERHRLEKRSYSPTALQSYAACPYRFLLHSIYYIRPREEAAPLEEVDPLTRGALFHHVQFVLFNALQEAELLPVNEERLDDALAVLEQSFSDVSKRYEDDLAPAIPRVWAQQMDAIRTDLRAWLRTIASKHAQWRPIHAELAFGLPNDEERDEQSTTRPVRILGRFDVRGSIDLVEENIETKAVRVTDHKTGRAPEPYPLSVGGGQHLQPMIYALAAQGMLDRPVVEGRLFYCTARGNFEEVVIPSNEATQKKLETVLDTIDRAVADGFFPTAPQAGACRWCDYRSVCGPHEEQRLQRKKQDVLVTLEKLRGMS